MYAVPFSFSALFFLHILKQEESRTMAINMVIEVDCGVSVYLGSMLITDPYETFLEGSPNELINQMMMRGRLATIRQVFGPKPVHIMEPTTFTNTKHQQQFFPVLMAAHLWSGTQVKDVTMHGSQLIIIQFHKEFSLNLLGDFVSRLKPVKWREYATDFLW
jgi:hypothetical protein